jgi:succinoglycan biosynthesis transport protein ExoP
LLGLLIGLVLAFVRDVFDDRLRDPGQLERKLGVATLAVLPPLAGTVGDSWDGARRQGTELATVARPDSRAAEAVRSLRVTLAAVAERKNLRTILVVGADASVSPGRIVAELGVALAQSGRRVLLIATDMRGSPLPQIFGVADNTGLSDLLVGVGDPEALTRHPEQAAGTRLPTPVVRRLAVLASGSQKEHAPSLLDSSAMIDLLQWEREEHEFVLLDSPPATVAADVFALAAHVDGVIVIAREARASDRALEGLRRRLDQVGALLVGGVFIAGGRVGRHRHRPTGAQPDRSPPVASAGDSQPDEAGNGVLPASQPDEAGNGVLPASQPDEAGNGVLPASQPDQAGNGVLHTTRPLPAVHDEEATETSGGRARPS